MPVGLSRPRAVQLLDDRAFALRASIHEDFDHVWRSLVKIDEDASVIIVRKDFEGKISFPVVFAVTNSRKSMLLILNLQLLP